MTAIQTKSGEVLLVKVPEDVNWWDIIENTLGDFIIKTRGLPHQFLEYGTTSKVLGKEVNNVFYYDPDSFFLPKGSWKIIGKFSELEDKDFEEFVDYEDFFDDFEEWRYFKSYSPEDKLDFINSCCLETPKESFISLCHSQGIEDDLDNYLIIKKI
jgi:hypothetical protein